MITRIAIDGYKCFSKFDFLLEDPAFVFFSGRNGSGKSTLFEVLALVRDIAARGVPLVADDGRFLVMGSTVTRWKDKVDAQTFEIEATIDGHAYHYRLVVDAKTPDRTPRVHQECLECEKKPVFSCEDGAVSLSNNRGQKKVAFHVDWSKSFLSSVAERPESARLTAFRKWLSQITVLRPSPSQMSSVASREARSPTPDLHDFTSWFRYLKQSGGDERYVELLEDLKLTIPGLCGMPFDDIGDKAKELFVEIRGKDRRLSRYSFAELSEGQRMLIALYSIVRFALTDGATICLDEPDNFLSVGEVSSLIGALRDVCDDLTGGQAMVISHHPEFYRQVGLENGFVFGHDPSAPVAAKGMGGVLHGKTGVMSLDDIIARGWEI